MPVAWHLIDEKQYKVKKFIRVGGSSKKLAKFAKRW